MPIIPSEEELRSMLSEGQTLYQISRQFNTTITEIFKLGRSYGIHFAYDHNHIPRPTKQDLESMYHDEGMTQYQISREFDVVEQTASAWLRKHKIPTRGSNGTLAVPMPPKEVLERMYNDEGMTQYQIAKEFDVDQGTVSVWFYIYKISTVGHMGGPINGSIVPIPPKEVLERMYNDEGMTQYQIAKEFVVHQGAVYNWFRKHKIPTRGSRGTLAVPRPPKDELLNYIGEGLNQHQIAKEYKVSDWKIFDWCEHYDIPGMVNGYRFTTQEHIKWRDAVLARDNYICQECGSQYKLQSHHIVPYCDHPEIAYELENGITLCKECHVSIRGREYEYLEQFAAITQPHLREHEVIESMPWEAPLPILQPNLFPDYQQEVIKL